MQFVQTKLQNPVWLENALTRLDYFITSLSEHTELYKFTESIDAEINTKSERLQLIAHLNGKNVSVPNLPLWFNRHFDAKYDRLEQIAFNFGYARKSLAECYQLDMYHDLKFSFLDMCSIISSSVNTFDDKAINLEKSIQSNCSVLLVADCSSAARFAIFAAPLKIDGDVESFTLEIHIDDHIVRYSPSNNGRDIIHLGDSNDVEVKSLVNPLGDAIEFR